MVLKVTQRQLQAVGVLVKEGFSSSGATAVIGNYSWECGSPNLPTAFRTAHLDHGSNGLAQWRLGRLTNYMKFVAAKQPDLDQDDFSPDGELWPFFGRLDYQLQFTAHEMRNEYVGLYAKLVKGGSVASLTADVCWQYERPNKAMAHLSDRVNYSKAIAAAVAKSPIQHDLPTQIAADIHEHEQQQTVATGMAAVPVAALGVAGVGGVAHSFTIPWYIWVFVAACVFVFVAGVIAFLKSRQVANNLKSAVADVTPDAPPAAAKSDPTPQSQPKPPNDLKVTRNKALAIQARDDEARVLSGALH